MLSIKAKKEKLKHFQAGTYHSSSFKKTNISLSL